MNEIVNFQGDPVEGAGDDAGTQSVDRFVASVGDKVRKARQRKGIPRRVLSELSGVSQRYLAQLESGTGNISIALLYRVADALDHRVEWLIGAEDPWDSEISRFSERFRSASEAQRRAVMQVLDPDTPAEKRAGRICLIGLRGAGKSTLGKRLGEKISVPFLELNKEIEEQAGMPVEEVMALYGQEGYRRLERQALERLVATSENLVLAVAGGIVSEPETYGFLLANFHTIWLRAQPEEHMERVRAQGDERPMAGNPKAMDELRSILTSREILYGRADGRVDTSGQTPEQSLDALMEELGRIGIG